MMQANNHNLDLNGSHQGLYIHPSLNAIYELSVENSKLIGYTNLRVNGRACAQINVQPHKLKQVNTKY